MPSIHSEQIALEYGQTCYNEVLSTRYYLQENAHATIHIGKPRAKWTGMDYGQWAQVMWECLPNTQDIRHGPFFLLCDLAEWWVFGNESGSQCEML